jgi:CRP/FNR family transcriptional regulator, nitrogen fixation regulation protein
MSASDIAHALKFIEMRLRPIVIQRLAPSCFGSQPFVIMRRYELRSLKSENNKRTVDENRHFGVMRAGVTMTRSVYKKVPPTQREHDVPARAWAYYPVTSVCDDHDEEVLKRVLQTLRRGPIHYHRNNVIVCEGDPADFMFLGVGGTIRTCRTLNTGGRSIIAFYLPGDLFGWTNDLTHPFSVEAATDAMVLFLRRSTLQSIASRESRIASFLQAATINELRRAQEHALLMSRDAKCRVAAFLIDMWTRLGKPECLDLPMLHQDIADHLGITLSRTITDMERAGIISRGPDRQLLLRNRPALLHMMN